VVYEEGGRPETNVPGVVSADDLGVGMYALTGYRFKWLGLMPFFMFEYAPVSDRVNARETPNEAMLIGGGLNARPIAQVAVKLAYDHAILPENRPGTFDEAPLNRLQAQVAWAF
jgi:hypothetical protein